jgi:hypothetical protein
MKQRTKKRALTRAQLAYLEAPAKFDMRQATKEIRRTVRATGRALKLLARAFEDGTRMLDAMRERQSATIH